MLNHTLAIAKNAFIESVRQPIYLLLVVLSGLVQVFNTWNTGFSMGQEETTELAGDTKLLFDVGLSTVFLAGTLLAGFIATAVMSREIENKTVLTVLSKPVGRTALVLGKFLGVAGAILIAVVIMLVFLLLAVRHGVMSTAADELDWPVILFGVGAVFLAATLAAWFNFFYGSNFPQTTIAILFPLALAAYTLMLLFDKHWKLQPPSVDFKSQVLIACACLAMAILVLTSVATAASTRLAQVPTILVCMGVLVAALLSNHLLGRRVFVNQALGVVAHADPVDVTKKSFSGAGEEFLIRLEQPPLRNLSPRDFFYYSPSPNGYPMIPEGEFAPYTGSLDELSQMLAPGTGSAILITEAAGLQLKIRQVGAAPVRLARPPEKGDYIFSQHTRINAPALVAWGAVPNMQVFWLLDAVSQSRDIPPRYVATAAAYAACQVGVFLSLAVLLFQRRDVG